MHLTPSNHGLDSLLTVWGNAQTLPLKVTRWGRYVDADDRLRRQTNLQHCFSVVLLATIVLPRLRSHIDLIDGKLDESLVLRAFILHEEGEALLGRDVIWQDKAHIKDLEEYTAFIEQYKALSPFDLKKCQEAFLLQFARKNPECFPVEARCIMRRLFKKSYFEALAFEAIETVDYLLYALECHDDHTDEVVLAHVLRNQIPRLDEFAVLLPGFKVEVWTKKLRKYCREKLKQFSHVE